MPNALSQFNFQTNTIRTIAENGEIWFVAKDVAQALEYSSTNMTTIFSAVPEEWKGSKPIATLGGNQKLLMISEQGLYFFLGRSDKPKALPFQKWLAGEVLSTIRKTGAYVHKAYKSGNRDALSAEQADSIRKALRHAADKLPKERQAQFMISGWSKLRAHFGCKYRDIPASEFSEALSIVARHITEYLTAPALPAQSSLIPPEQAEEIMIRLNRVGKIFHPFSDQFCDLNGIARLLRGLHPNLGTQEKGYVKIIEKQ